MYATHGKSGLSLDKTFRLNPSFDGFLKKSIDVDCFCIDHGLSKDNLLLTLLWSGIKTILSDRPYLSYLSSLSPLQITENNDSVSKAIEVFISERKDEALASYVEIKDRKQDVDMNSVSTVDEGQKTPLFTSHPIDFPAPAPIAYAIQQHAKVLSVTRDKNKPSHEVKALLWMAIQDLPEE